MALDFMAIIRKINVLILIFSLINFMPKSYYVTFSGFVPIPVLRILAEKPGRTIQNIMEGSLILPGSFKNIFKGV